MPTVFRDEPLHGRLVPMITVGISLGGVWYPVEVYVDSGAAYTVLRAQIAVAAGFGYLTGQRIFLQVGDGSFIPVSLHDLEVQLGAERFIDRIGFSERLGVAFNLLGRATIFDRFRICFLERQRLLTFEPTS